MTDLVVASSAGQAIISRAKPFIVNKEGKSVPFVIDGRWGSTTQAAYASLTVTDRMSVDAVVTAAGTSVKELAAAWNRKQWTGNANSALTIGAGKSTDPKDPKAIFDQRLVPAVMREAKARGMNPYAVIGQLALESTWGKSTPRADDGGPSYNYGGIKWAAVKTPKQAHSKTGEFLNGKSVSLTDSFAVFDSPEAFVPAYFNYLLNGPSSYRYKGLDKAKSASEFGSILQKGGYATDPQYASKLAAVAATAQKNYA